MAAIFSAEWIKNYGSEYKPSPNLATPYMDLLNPGISSYKSTIIDCIQVLYKPDFGEGQESVAYIQTTTALSRSSWP